MMIDKSNLAADFALIEGEAPLGSLVLIVAALTGLATGAWWLRRRFRSAS